MKVFFPKNKPRVSKTKEQHDREVLLDKVRAMWITGVLEQSLEKEARIALGLSEHPEAVLRSLDLVSRFPNQSPRHLPPNTRMIEVFDAHAGQFLILGAPGAGKTTLLLELTRALLTRAQQNPAYPIPVVFPLSSWAQHRKSLILLC
jgi:predicted NACHT family NTPase